MAGTFESQSEWRKSLVPASFRGLSFFTERAAQQSGRRVAVHEFPGRDIPFSEDMGRRAMRWTLSAYTLNENYTYARDAMIDACINHYGAAQLVLATQGTYNAICTSMTETEVREKGGIATFELEFVEIGSVNATGPQVDTAAQASASADAATAATQSAMTGALSST